MRSSDGQRWLTLAMAGGALLGLLYTLSPLTILVACGAVVLTAAAGRGLPREERRALIAILTIAFALRAAAVGALFLVNPHNSQGAGILFGDESYALYRSWRMRDLWLGIPMLKYDYLIAYDIYGRSNYLTAIAFVQTLFGPAPYALRLLNALIFVGAVLLLFRTIRSAFGPAVAFFGLVVLLFLPTLFFWSISLLKESVYFVLTAVVFVAAVRVAVSRSWPARAALVAASAAALWALRDLRTGAVILALGGIAIGIAGRFIFVRPWRIWAAAGVVGAAMLAIAVSPNVQARVLNGIDRAATEHSGHVFTVGHAYKLLDAPYYVFPHAGQEYSLSPSEATRFVLRAIASYVVTPLPWQIATTGELVYLPEQVFWYVLLALAPIGIVAGYRREPMLTSLLAGYLIPTAAVVALTTGNVGTLIRHRTLIVPYLIWLSAMGACTVVSTLTTATTARQQG